MQFLNKFNTLAKYNMNYWCNKTTSLIVNSNLKREVKCELNKAV